MNSPLATTLVVLLSALVVGGCAAETERPPAASLTVEIDETAAPDDDEPLPAVVAPSCVPLETRPCTRVWTTRLGTVDVPHCITSVVTCKGDGRTWTACGDQVQRAIN